MRDWMIWARASQMAAATLMLGLTNDGENMFCLIAEQKLGNVSEWVACRINMLVVQMAT